MMPHDSASSGTSRARPAWLHAAGRRAAWIATIAFSALQPVRADPLIPAGNVALRADIQLLADHGVIDGPVTSWPLAWSAIAADIADDDGAPDLPPHVRRALARVRDLARQAGAGGLHYRAALAGAANPSRLRSFADTPRESGEIGAGVSWLGDRLGIDLNGQFVGAPDDGKDFRYDGSFIGIALGNFTFGAGTLDRWWGPGWDGSLILSSNARPIPALTIDRNRTDALSISGSGARHQTGCSAHFPVPGVLYI